MSNFWLLEMENSVSALSGTMCCWMICRMVTNTHGGFQLQHQLQCDERQLAMATTLAIRAIIGRPGQPHNCSGTGWAHLRDLGGVSQQLCL